VEQLACDTAQWQSSLRLGLAWRTPPTLPMDRWTGPLPGFLTMHPIALVVFLLLVVLAVMLAALWL